MQRFIPAAAALTAALAASFIHVPAASAWEPTKSVEFIIPAGTGGGADQMARAVQGIVAKHNLMKQALLPINKAGGAGAEGFLDVKNANGDPHKIIITLSNLFTTPLATGVPFNWRDLTPVQMLALDNFVLWVNAKTPTRREGIHRGDEEGRSGQDEDGRHRREAGRPDHHRGDRAEDRREVHLHPVQGRRRGGDAARRRPRRLDGEQPDRGGGALALRGAAAPVRVRPEAHALQGEGHQGDVLGRHSHLQGAGLDVDYLMLRGIFTAPGVKPDQVQYYVDLFKKVMATPEWEKLMEEGAFNKTALTGKEYADWVAKEERATSR
jgi:putative tricarboxylic transport membrane protein